MDLGKRVGWVKERHGDQLGDLQEAWTNMVTVDLSEAKDGSGVCFSQQAALALPGLPLSTSFFSLYYHMSC